MRLTNKTHYTTQDLRKFVLAGLKARGASTRKHVHVGYPVGRRNSWGEAVHGSAVLGGRWREGWLITLSLPRERAHPGDLTAEEVVRLARVLHHEIAHSLGLRHKDMDPATRYCTETLDVSWANGLAIRTKPQVDQAVAASQRLEAARAHAQGMLARWQTKAKIAATKVKRWQRAVRRLG